MTAWVALLGGEFGLESEAISGRPTESLTAGAHLERLAGAWTTIRREVLRIETDVPQGASGLAADAFVALVGRLTQDMGSVAAQLAAAATILRGHGEQLDDLRRESEREFGLAVSRERHFRTTLADAAAIQEGWTASLLSADEATMRVEQAREELRQSLVAHHRLREAEADLDAATAARLGDLELSGERGSDEAVIDRVRQILPPMTLGTLDGWSQLQPVLLGAGFDLLLPGPDARPVECVQVDADGTVTVHVDGPTGGAFVVGEDISPEVFEVVVALLGGRLPDFRPFGQLHDLDLEEFSAVNWAFSSNYRFGQSPQTQIGGVNGAWAGYTEGGTWTAQDLTPLDGVGFASALMPGAETGRRYLLGQGALLALTGLRATESPCRAGFDGDRRRGPSDD